jgi:hypothetical protein
MIEQRVRGQPFEFPDVLPLVVLIARRLHRPRICDDPVMRLRLATKFPDPMFVRHAPVPEEVDDIMLRYGRGYYKRCIIRLVKDVLLINGNYPDWLILLLSEETSILLSVVMSRT